ncbi:MAG: M28 family peptidase [Dysgonamonadaceae bacterium]|nr:M28 family peptidase [Fermentimonas sp.]MDD3901741.1 M28 family peptidase [Dysgonamonadaceae bacterium]
MSADENKKLNTNERISLTPRPIGSQEDYERIPNTVTSGKTSLVSPDNINSLPTDESKNDALTSTMDTVPAGKTPSVNPDDSNSLSTDENKMMHTIEKLTLAMRPIGSKEEKAACGDLKLELETYGYQTEVQEFPYIVQSIKLRNTPFAEGRFWDFNIGQPDGTSQNLIGIKKPTIPASKDIIIVSAHYDTTIRTTGAIDNASGVAVLMEVARNTANLPSNIEVRFLLCAGEENYLYGSRYYVNSLSDDERRHIIADINLDCIGEEGSNQAILGTNNGKENAACKLFADYGMQIERGPMSDYYSFEKAGIPALTIAQYPVMIGTGQELPDDIARIDKTKLKAVADMVAKVLLNAMGPQD